jgi:hypothetical protein
MRFLDGIQIFALKIFYQGQFQNRAVIGFADNDRHFEQPQHSRRTPSPFAGN